VFQHFAQTKAFVEGLKFILQIKHMIAQPASNSSVTDAEHDDACKKYSINSSLFNGY